MCRSAICHLPRSHAMHSFATCLSIWAFHVSEQKLVDESSPLDHRGVKASNLRRSQTEVLMRREVAMVCVEEEPRSSHVSGIKRQIDGTRRVSLSTL